MFRGAQLVSGVFKVAAWLTLIGGVISAIAAQRHEQAIYASNSALIVTYIVVGSVLTASVFAFFAYVLDLLRAAVVGRQ
jgi:hypothetical protein